MASAQMPQNGASLASVWPLTFKGGDLVVTLVMGVGVDPMALHKKTTFRANLEKYRMKCSTSVALGLDYGDPAKAFDCAIWVEGP